LVPAAALAEEAVEPVPTSPIDQVDAPGDAASATVAIGPVDEDGILIEDEVIFDPLDPEQAFRDIVFPIVGVTSFSATYGACRDGCTRTHMGADIATYGWKGASVVAAHDGTIVSARVGGELSGCSVEVLADDGWTTRYLHLNDDVPGTDLKDGRCFAPGIEVGTWVAAGTLIGWVGDSGNAEGTTPHLHFEIRNPEGLAVEPWYSLVDARHVDFDWIDADDLIEISRSGFDPDVSTALVVETGYLQDLAVAHADVTQLSTAVIPFDPANPAPALAALLDLAPDRIVVLADGSRPAFTDELRAYAPLVAVGLLPDTTVVQAENDAETSSTTEDVPIDAEFHHQAVEDRIFTLIAGRNLTMGLQAEIAALGFTHRIVTLETENTPTGNHGSNALTQPDRSANHDVLWWNTSNGWVFSDPTDSAPDPGFAFVSSAELTPWTLAYLTSLAVAPPMPLWHNELTQRPSRSL
jgi:murein DD-endopeptidase MepM/ murein hydrolase activator NlpD